MRLRKRYTPDLAKMAAICETNYVQLLKLLPKEQKTHSFSLTNGDKEVAVTLSITEEHRYTTMLEVSQHGMHNQWLQPQSMQVRMYHDANMAEVMGYQQQQH